jgi:hypothetical protein
MNDTYKNYEVFFISHNTNNKNGYTIDQMMISSKIINITIPVSSAIIVRKNKTNNGWA